MPGKNSRPQNGRPVWAEVSLGAIGHNFHAIQKWIGPERGVLAVVKADAYGHGASAVARALEKAGAAAFAVTCVTEGAELREARIRQPILVLTGWWDGETKSLFEYRLTPTIHRLEDLAELEHAAAAYARSGRRTHPAASAAWPSVATVAPTRRGGSASRGDVAPTFRSASCASPPGRAGATSNRRGPEAPGRQPFHLKIDTGMNRLGISPTDVEKFAPAYADCKHLDLTGTFTHFASSEDFVHHQADEQEQVFAEAVAHLRRVGVNPGALHMANSAAIASRPSSWGDLVRPGALLYGYHQNYSPPERLQTARECLELQPALSLRARIISVRDVPAGTAIGYNGKYVTPRRSRIAVIAAGYADGVVRRLTGVGRALVRGAEVPLVGAISMDLTMLDVTDVTAAQVGDVVTIFGADGTRRISPFCVARELGTVTSDLLCSVGKRVPRRYSES
jgi:alanine racemase